MRSPILARRRTLAAPFLPPLAAVVALVAFAASQRDAGAAAETAFLALLAAAVLLAVAALESFSAAPGGGSRGGLGATAAVLVVLAGWALPAGPLRGATVAVLLVATLALAVARRLAGGPPPVGDPTSAPVSGVSSSLALVLPLAVAAQVVVRAERLLAPEPGWRFLAGLLGLPVLAAVAAAFLVARDGRAPALVALATAVLLGPGFTPATTSALVLLAAAEALWRPVGDHAARRRQRWAAAPALGAAAIVLSLLSPGGGAVAVAAALLLGGRPVVSVAVGLVPLLGLVVVFRGPAGWSEDLAGAATTLAPLAIVLLLAARRREARRWIGAVVAAGLAAAAAAWLGFAPGALAALLAAVPLLAGHSLAQLPPAERHALFAPQVVWSAASAALVLLAASYPWLRSDPLRVALELLGVASGWAGWLVVAAVAATVLALGAALPRPRGTGGRSAPRPAGGRPPVAGRGTHPHAARSRWTATFAGLAVVAAATAGLTPAHPPVVLLSAPLALDAAHPRLVLELPAALSGLRGRRSLGLVVDTSLSHAVAVRDREPVAELRVAAPAEPGSGGGSSPSTSPSPSPSSEPGPAAASPAAEGWILTAGGDTAEWAIRRPDVALAAAHRSPRPWLARVTEERFFGLSFRSHGELAATGDAGQLVIERDPGLPEETVVHLHRLEVRP